MEYLIKNVNQIDKNQINMFYNTIPTIKRNKIDKLKNDIDKTRSIVGELLLSELLSKHGIDYKDINYQINEYGKPYIDELYFNISHKNDYVITVINEKEIGVDIEEIKSTPINTINQFATNKEKEYILSSDNKIKSLFQIYTLKEAYFKMKGTNLNNILDVEFIIDNNTIHCSDNTVEVGFINDIDGYIISYCIEKKLKALN